MHKSLPAQPTPIGNLCHTHILSVTARQLALLWSREDMSVQKKALTQDCC